MQLTARRQVATPVSWKQSEDVIIVPAVSDEAAKEKYPEGWKAPRPPYLRIVPQSEQASTLPASRSGPPGPERPSRFTVSR